MNIDEAIRSAKKYYRLGNLNKVESIFREILIINPDIAEIYYYLGAVLQEKKQLEEAISCYRKALELNHNIADVYHYLGIALQEKKQLEEAISCYQKALELNPNLADAYYNLGNALYEKKQLEEAISCYQKALELNPNLADAYYNLGNVFKEQGNSGAAITNYEMALSLKPDFPQALNNLGNVLQSQGKIQDAVKRYNHALAVNPDYADAYNNLGMALKEQNKLKDAILNYEKAIAIDPHYAAAYNNMGIALQELDKLKEAKESYQRVLEINPHYAEALCNLGNVLKAEGKLNEAERLYRQAMQIKNDYSACYSNLLLLMNYNSCYDAQTIFSEHLKFAELYAETSSTILYHANTQIPDRTLRIGYVSPDFKQHPVSYFIEPVLYAHNRQRFEVFCYSNALVHDEVTERLKEYAYRWRDIVGMSDEKATELIRADHIDILVDLAGHTAKNRMLLFMRKPAPVQVTWIGYPATTGLSTIDYKIVDNYTDPPGKTEQFYSEKLIRLPESFVLYLPVRNSPDVSPLPALTSRHITFGSFNNFVKVTPEMFALWAKILNALPNSHLLMKWKSFSDKTVRDHTIKMFKKRGIDTERIILQSWENSPEHFKSYDMVDIGLDTFPFNGLTTTCESLWMGVPVISLAGTAYASRAGVSVLSNVGLPDLIAITPDEYINIAVRMANDIPRLQQLRGNLREMMAHSPITNTKRFVSNLENCYRKMWEKWCNAS